MENSGEEGEEVSEVTPKRAAAVEAAKLAAAAVRQRNLQAALQLQAAAQRKNGKGEQRTSDSADEESEADEDLRRRVEEEVEVEGDEEEEEEEEQVQADNAGAQAAGGGSGGGGAAEVPVSEIYGRHTNTVDTVIRKGVRVHWPGWHGYPYNWWSITVGLKGTHITGGYFARLKQYFMTWSKQASAPLEPGDKEGHIHCQACALIACPAEKGEFLKEHIKKEIGVVIRSGIYMKINCIKGGEYSAEAVCGYTGKNRGNIGYTEFLHNIEEAAFAECVEVWKRLNTDAFKGKMEICANNVVRVSTGFVEKKLKQSYVVDGVPVPIPSIILAMGISRGYCVKDSFTRDRNLGQVSMANTELSMRFNYAPKSMSVNDICKLFFGEDSLPARHRQKGQDRYFIDRGTSGCSDPYDKPGMVWRGMDYDAFVTKLKEAAVARADDTIQDEIG
eukprot:g2492.t1